MTEAEKTFRAIAEKMETREGFSQGAMMSAPGIKKNKKVFAFYYKEAMCFRLGKTFNPAKLGIADWSYLSPFKNKPPMKGWFIIPFEYANMWEDLCGQAAEGIK